jgi:Cu/Ag efflux protein CusF
MKLVRFLEIVSLKPNFIKGHPGTPCDSEYQTILEDPMIKKFALFAFLLLFACVGFAFAQEDQQQPPEDQQQLAPPQEQQQTPTSQNQQLQGVVSKIDLVKKTITLKDEISKTTQDLDFNESTALSKAGNPLTVAELKKGDRVSVEVDSQNLVTKIEITPAEATPPPEEEKQ